MHIPGDPDGRSTGHTSGERTMRTRRFGALLAALATAACAAPAASGQHTHGHAPAEPAAAGREYTAADVHFMVGMIGHHAQAIEMARLAPERAASPAVRTLAARIISSQEDEIALMQQWLRERGEPVPEARVSRTMTMNGMAHEMEMPGLLTEEQMARLGEASGAAFDRLFLSSMIRHHQGAVSMVTELFSSQGAGLDRTVFKLASDVNVDQTTEIERMRRMLTDLLVVGGAP